jgi:acyl-CoA synthetase (AMP-forming)/AMP-acid ligase II
MSQYKTERMQCIADCVRYHAERQPDRVATIYEDREQTYADLDRASSKVANGLISLGVTPQTRVSYLGKNCDLHTQIQMGVAKANAVLTPVNWRLAAPEVRFIIDHCDAQVLFVGPEFTGLVKQIRGELTSLKTVIALDGAYEDWPDYATWRDGFSDEDPRLPVSGDDICFQLYTSGTTGRPKGAMLRTAGVFTGFDGVPMDPELLKGTWMEQAPEDVTLLVAPNFHLSGNGNSYLTIRGGGTMMIHPDFDIDRVLSDIQQFKLARTFMVPAMLKFVLDKMKRGEVDLSSVKTISYGASPIPLDLMREAVEMIGCGFVQIYGMTEIGGGCTILDPSDHDVAGNEKMKSCGKATPLNEIKIVNPSTGEELPRRDAGEIWVKTPSIMAGYYKQPEETASAVTDGWYHTGDVGMMDEEGYIYIQDRLKDMIVSGGENIYCAEVESALFSHPSIKDVAVIGVPSEKWGEEVKALVELEPGKTLTEEELIIFAREQIAGFKVPKSVEFRDDLARNASGKLVKKDLREPYWRGYERRVS